MSIRGLACIVAALLTRRFLDLGLDILRFGSRHCSEYFVLFVACIDEHKSRVEKEIDIISAHLSTNQNPSFSASQLCSLGSLADPRFVLWLANLVQHPE
jgi:hypothetical protein